MAITVAVPKETSAGERRVSMVPEAAARLSKSGFSIQVESGAGAGSYYSDSDYEKAGAGIVKDRRSLLSSADIVLAVQPPKPEDILLMKQEAIAIGFMNPFRNEK